MSESDSDLDFESADEGQNVDIDIENDEDFDFLKNDSKIESPSKKESFNNKEEAIITSPIPEKENDLTIVSPLAEIPKPHNDIIEKAIDEKSAESGEKENVDTEADSDKYIKNMPKETGPKHQKIQLTDDTVSQKEFEANNCKENTSKTSSFVHKEHKEEFEIENEKPKLENIQRENINKTDNIKSDFGWNDNAWDDADLDEIDENMPTDQIDEQTVQPKSNTVLNNTPGDLNKNKNIINVVSKQETQEESRDFTSLFDKKLNFKNTESNNTNANNNNSGGGGGWSWSKIGSNFLSTAVNLTSNSISTVLETVEATIGAPDPAELAAKIKKSESELKIESDNNQINQSATVDTKKSSNTIDQNDWNNDEEWFTMNPLNKLATTGLSVLETVGKKTIEAISEKDPNFRQTREFLKQVPISNTKPNLSQLLREAQQVSEKVITPTSNSTTFVSDQTKPKQPEKPTFSHYFDEFKGNIHLEALEMLSRQMSVKLEMLKMNPFGDKMNSIKSKLEQLDQLFDADNLNLDNDSDTDDNNEFKLLISSKEKLFDIDHFEYLINEYSKRLSFKIVFDKVKTSFRTTSHSVKESTTLADLHNESIKCFALITSSLIELYHKSAEAFIVDQTINKKSSTSIDIVLENAEALNQITRLSTRCVTILADDYSKKCKSIDKTSNQIVTNVYLEASNSNTYICDAYLLFLPIFKSQLMEKI